MDLTEMGLGGIDWIVVALDRDQLTASLNMVMDLHVTHKIMKNSEATA
jgi:hypothetical protein